MKRLVFSLAAFLPFSISVVHGIDIVIDYTYDTNNFFDTQQKKDALQAVVDRYSRILTGSLSAVAPSGTAMTDPGWRIGFIHPGTGISYQVSTAAGTGSDALIVAGAGPADEYGFAGLQADVWILYAGGRSLGSAGVGGTGTGSNFTDTFDDPDGPMKRGVPDDNAADDSTDDLPRWGGSIAFDTGTNWHFDLTQVAPVGKVDFYSIALHEVGHALGLATNFNQLPDNGSGQYTGVFAVAAYNADNGTSLSSLSLVSSGNVHFADNVYQSFIFSDGIPNSVGVVGSGVKQDLLMEPVADFSAQQQRFELTNVDVASLRDVGWTTLDIAPPPDIFRPDSLVGPFLTTAKGDGIYGTFGGQSYLLVSKKARTVTGIFAVENDGNQDDSYTVSGGRGNRLFRVVYTSSGSNVTASVMAGTHNTGVLSPGDPAHVVSLLVKPNKSKIRKKIRRTGQPLVVKYRKKKISLPFNAVSDTDANADDFGVIQVKTK